jgi:uncharacterized protein (TIGR02231 family)
MRLALALALALPAPAVADVFTVDTAPTSVLMYTFAGAVTREFSVDLPQGSHEIILPNLPQEVEPEFLQISVSGAQLSNIQFRNDYLAPQPDTDSPGVKAAKNQIKEAEDALLDLEERIAAARLAAQGAIAKEAFLANLGQNEGLPGDVETLRALARMVGSETQDARNEMLQADQAVRAIEEEREALDKALKDARDALAALVPPPEETSELKLFVTADQAGKAAFAVSYMIEAQWQPLYDVYLDGGDQATVSIRRQAILHQLSSESWKDVSVTLSTAPFIFEAAPREPEPIRLGLSDTPIPVGNRDRTSMGGVFSGGTLSMFTEEVAATADLSGAIVTYSVPSPVSIARDVETSTVALDTLALDAQRFARAVPAIDKVAFLMGRFTNDTGEPLLASGAVRLYADNTLVGVHEMPLVPAGAEVEMPFGQIQSLRLKRVVLDESEGDRGIITRSNSRAERTRMDIENLGMEDWDVEVRAAVPHAVEEDLVIDWTALPAPDAEDVDDKKGVLQWDISVPAGTTSSITIEQEISWPEGKVLR